MTFSLIGGNMVGLVTMYVIGLIMDVFIGIIISDNL